MATRDIDDYLAGLEAGPRKTLETLRTRILAVVPDAEQGLAYGLPAFRVEAGTVAGFGAFRQHLAYLPHSGSVLATLQDELSAYSTTKGSLHFPVDQPLSEELVRLLVTTRLTELDRR